MARIRRVYSIAAVPPPQPSVPQQRGESIATALLFPFSILNDKLSVSADRAGHVTRFATPANLPAPLWTAGL